MQETNLLAAGVPPRTVLGELTAHPDLLVGGEGAGCPFPQEPSSPGPDLSKLAHGFHGPWLPQKTVKNIT